MRANKHLLLWSSVATLVIVMSAIAKENFFQEWRNIQQHIRAELPGDEAERFEVKLRQIVAPAVGATDRCVTCHVGMLPGETGIAGDRLWGAHADVYHSPEDFGCTICHGGQGRATTSADAHGYVEHWPEPMLPTAYLYAGCGTCHSYAGIPSYDRLQEGKAIAERLGCGSCHRMTRSGAPTAGASAAGPDLWLEGARGVPENWVARHSTVDAGEGAKAIASISARDRAWVRDYLASRVGAEPLVEAQATFNRLGCRGCHQIDSIGGDTGPALDLVGLKSPVQTPFSRLHGPPTLTSFFQEHFRDPQAVSPGSRMPKEPLSDDEIERLTLYMFSLRRRDLPSRLWPADRLRVERLGATPFVDDGRGIVEALCTGCHGRELQGGLPNPNSSRKDFPSLDQLAARYQLYDSDDVATVVADLRAHGALSPQRPLEVARWASTSAQDAMVRTLLANGNPSGRERLDGPLPVDMPAWGNTLDQRQITQVVIRLLSISKLEDADEDDDEADGDASGGGGDEDTAEGAPNDAGAESAPAP